MENIKLLFQLYVRPASAMSEILDKGSWLFAAVLVLFVSITFFWTINSKLQAAYTIPSYYDFYSTNYDTLTDDPTQIEIISRNADREYRKLSNEREKIPFVDDYFFGFFSFAPTGFFLPLLSISIFYVPFVILLTCIFGSIGSFGIILRRDYAALATCSLMAWAAAHLPFATAGIFLNSTSILPQIYLIFWVASGLIFGALMIFAVRTVFGTTYGTAVLVIGFAWLALIPGIYLFQFSPWLFSPFLIIFAVIFLSGFIGNEVSGFSNTFRQRQNFKRFLHNATVNPKDADAHVQLGLIYLQRRQQTKAFEHFTKAVEIDAEEIDANYQLGKIAREKGEFQKALDYFSIVAAQNDKYALSEVWREIGATYLEAGMFKEAQTALVKFITHRPVDSEGLYYLGKIYKEQNKPEKAREMFEQAIESANNSPDYRRRELKYWSKLAQKEM